MNRFKNIGFRQTVLIPLCGFFFASCDRIPPAPGSAPGPSPASSAAETPPTSLAETPASATLALHVSGDWQGKWQEDYAVIRVRWGTPVLGGWLQRVFQDGELVTLGQLDSNQTEWVDKVSQAGSYEYRLRAASNEPDNPAELGPLLASRTWTLAPPPAVERVFDHNTEVVPPFDFQKLVLGKGATLRVSVPSGIDFLALREIHADQARIELVDASPFSKRRQVKLRVETVTGSLEIETMGRAGSDGAPGRDGNRGANGSNGADATTRQSHRWVMAGIPLSWNASRYRQEYTECASAPTNGGAGGNGQDGEAGEPGEDGGPALDLEIQIKEQHDARISVSSTGGSGGKGGAGGKGGEAGIGGAAGKQDSEKICPAATDGANGSAGRNASPGRDGRTGPAGQVRWTRF